MVTRLNVITRRLAMRQSPSAEEWSAVSDEDYARSRWCAISASAYPERVALPGVTATHL
jgi:hypothetical protein